MIPPRALVISCLVYAQNVYVAPQAQSGYGYASQDGGPPNTNSYVYMDPGHVNANQNVPQAAAGMDPKAYIPQDPGRINTNQYVPDDPGRINLNQYAPQVSGNINTNQYAPQDTGRIIPNQYVPPSQPVNNPGYYAQAPNIGNIPPQGQYYIPSSNQPIVQQQQLPPGVQPQYEQPHLTYTVGKGSDTQHGAAGPEINVLSPVHVNQDDADQIDDLIIPPEYADNLDRFMKEETNTHESAAVDEAEFAKKWETLMKDFTPQTIVTFKMHSSETQNFYQVINEVNTVVRGGTFENTAATNEKSEFHILSPSNKVVFYSDLGDTLFKITAEETGEYTFIITNSSRSSNKYITLLIGAGEETQLSASELSSVSGSIQKLRRHIGEIETHSSLYWSRKNSQLEGITNTTSRTYAVFVTELLFTIAIAGIQWYAVTKMLASKRLF